MQLLSLLKAQNQTQGHHFKSAEEIQQNIAACLTAVTLPAMAELLEQDVYAEVGCFSGDSVTFYTYPF